HCSRGRVNRHVFVFDAGLVYLSIDRPRSCCPSIPDPFNPGGSMIRTLRVPLALALLAALAACQQQSAPPPAAAAPAKPAAATPAPAAPAMTAAPTATADSVGVPECDDYLNKYQACVDSKVPEASRAALKQS